MSSPTSWPTQMLLGLFTLAALAACLPTYDPDETTLAGGSGGPCSPTGPEVCDGADNDCDGAIDEDFPTRGLPCGNNIGACVSVRICLDGEESCYAAIEASDEVCDGVDNDCDGQVDEVTETDPLNCGRCGVACNFDNAVPGCVDSECVLTTCVAGFENCDGDPTNGCETDTTSDPINCGGCGNICGDDSAQTVCTAGVCSIEECLGGRTDCNEIPLDGCEADLGVDTFNCGLCGRTCGFDNAEANCFEANCTFESCHTGFADADSDEANGCEIGIRVAGSPPDPNLAHLTAVEGRFLYGAAGRSIYGYELDEEGAIGPLLFTYAAASDVVQLDAEGDHVFVALEAGDVQILDASDSGAVAPVGVAITSGPEPGFARTGDVLYIADGRDGLRVVSVADPSAPQLLGHASAPSIVSIAAVVGDRLILAEPGRADVYIYDVSDPAKPIFKSEAAMTGPFDHISVNGDLLITGIAGVPSIDLYRLTEEDHVSFLGSSDLPGGLVDFQQRFPFLISVSSSPSTAVAVVLLDIRRPQRPTVTTSFQTGVPNPPSSATFTSNQIYVAGQSGLQRFDTTDVRTPISAQDLVRPQRLDDLEIQGNLLFVVADGTLEVLDVTDPVNPRRTAKFGTTVRSVAVTQTSAFVAADEPPIAQYALDGLNDTPAPTAIYGGQRPSFMVASADGSYVFGVEPGGGTLDAIQFPVGVATLQSSVSLGSTCSRGVRDGTSVYLACTSGLVVVDTAIPNAPTAGPALGDGSPLYDLHLLGQTLYGVSDGSILTFQIGTEGVVNHLATVPYTDLSGLRQITGLGLWLIAASGETLTLFDRSNLSNPQMVVSRPLTSTIVDMVRTQDFIYAGTNDGVFRLAIEGNQ